MYRKSLGLHKTLGSKEGMASSYGNLGNLYLALEDLSLACENWKKSKALFEEVGIPGKAKLVEKSIAESGCS